MAEVKVVIGTKEGKTYSKAISASDFEKFIGKKMGETIRGETIGLTGYELKITGGSDNSGFPMRLDVESQARKKVLLHGGTGFNPKRRGQRKRRTIHGNTISANIAQINCFVTKAGKDPITKLFGLEEVPAENSEAPKEETKAEEKKEDLKTEEKPMKEKEESKPAEQAEEKPTE